MARPVKWDILAQAMALDTVREVQAASAAGTIRRNLSTLTAACEYLTEDTPEAAAWRAKYDAIPHGITMATLRNRMSALQALIAKASR